MLSEIYYLKKRILQLENLRCGTGFSDSQFQNFHSIYGDAKTVDELEAQLNEFKTDFIEQFIPKDIMEEWEYCDYDVYTDAHHHRKFWDEIENDCSVEYFLNKFFELLGIEVDESDDMMYIISLYDFNNYNVYFKTEAEMNSFLENYAVEPCTCFERENGVFVETWSA